MVLPTPTAAELAILPVLWRTGPATVRAVHEEVYAGTETGYTGTLKLMQNLLSKGLVTRTVDGRSHIYTAAVSEKPMMARVARRLINQSIGGSPLALAMQLLDTGPVDAAELAQLKAMIARLEGDGSP